MNDNLETMNDKVFQYDRLEALFKKYSTKENPCNITTFIKTTYGKKANVVANMKVKVSRLINRKPDATQNLGLLELSDALADYFNKHHRTNGDEILSMTHFLGKQSIIDVPLELTSDGSCRTYEKRDMWSLKVDAKYSKMSACYIRTGIFAGFIRLFLNKGIINNKNYFVDPNTEFKAGIVRQRKTDEVFWGMIKPLKQRKYSICDFSAVSGEKIGEVATNIEICAMSPFYHHYKPQQSDFVPPKR
tara:strand:- start:93 stop:830 length:738 start_codon:yes stop_codon:yes gene_type:complete